MTAFGAKREAGHSGKLEEGRDGLKYNRSSAPSDDQPNAGPNRLHFRIPVPCTSIRHTKAALSQKLRWPQNSNASQVASARHTTQTPPFLVSNSPGNTSLIADHRHRPAPRALDFCYRSQISSPSRSGCTTLPTYGQRSAARLIAWPVWSTSVPSHNRHCGMLPMCSCSPHSTGGYDPNAATPHAPK